MKKYKDLSADEIESAWLIVYGCLTKLSNVFYIEPHDFDRYCQIVNEVVNHCIKVKRNHYVKKKRKWYEIWKILK